MLLRYSVKFIGILLICTILCSFIITVKVESGRVSLSNPNLEKARSRTIPLPPTPAIIGTAQGKLGIVYSSTKAVGFSGYTEVWTSTDLSGNVLRTLNSDNIGFILTTEKIYAYKPAFNRWTKISYIGVPCGQDIEGPLAVFWTTQACYATSILFTVWHSLSLQTGEVVRGGGSAGNFGIFWTNQRAFAYTAGSGQWIQQPLTEPVIGGIAHEDFGMVWTSNNAYTFSTNGNQWRSVELTGVNGAGSGNVGLIWNQVEAKGYSCVMDEWYPLIPSDVLEGGLAGGDVALVWTKATAYAFSPETGQWYEISLEKPIDQALVSGNVALLVSQGTIYGFTNLDVNYESWCSQDYQGDVLKFVISDFSGILVTTEKIYAFKAGAIQNRWTISGYTGHPLNQDVVGATVVFWTDEAMYGTSSSWTHWYSILLQPGETILAGGSAGSFAIVWTPQNSWAFSGAQGEWISEELCEPGIGGIYGDNLGIVYNDSKAYVFDHSPESEWIMVPLNDSFTTMHASGEDTIGLLWSGTSALVYSSLLRSWSDFESGTSLTGGHANGEVALLWTNTEAYGFCTSQGNWSSISLQ